MATSAWSDDDVVGTPADRARRLDALRFVESGGNPNAVSKAGAQGPYQFMPATARAMGVSDPFNEEQARNGADRYLQQLESQFGDPDLALLAYNWGPGNVQSWLKTGKGIKGQPMPTEAQQYVSKVKSAEGRQQPTVQQEWSDADIIPSSPQQPKKADRKQLAKAYADGDEAPGTVTQFLGGAKHAWDNAANTLAGLFGDTSLQPLVEQGKAFVEETGPASSVGNFTGEVLLTAAPAARAAKYAAGATKGGKVLKAATGGAAAGAASEGMMGRDVGEGAVAGAVAGPAILGAGKMLGKAYDAAKDIGGGAYNRAAENVKYVFSPKSATDVDRLPQARDALRNLTPEIPGEVMTVGKAATDVLPEFAGFERAARRGPSSHLFSEADRTNKMLRDSALRNIAEEGDRAIDPATGKYLLSPAEQVREAMTRPLYDTAMPNQVPITGTFERLLNAPEVRSAMSQADDVLEQLTANARQQGNPLPPRPRYLGDQIVSMPVEHLQRVSRTIGERLNKDPSNYVLIDAKRAIDKAMKDASPEYREATELFRKYSAPQNRADVARNLEETLNPALGNRERAEMFVEKLRNAKTMFKKEGLPRFQTLEQVFLEKPQDLASIRQVESALQRDARIAALPDERTTIPMKPSRFEKLWQLAPQVMNRYITLIRGYSRYLMNQSDEKVQAIIDRAAADPAEMIKLLETVPPSQRSQFAQTMKSLIDRADVQGALVAAPITGEN